MKFKIAKELEVGDKVQIKETKSKVKIKDIKKLNGIVEITLNKRPVFVLFDNDIVYTY